MPKIVNDEAALKKRFEFLSQNTNVECSAKFEASIATMAARCEASGLLLRADGRGPLPSAD